MAATMLSTLRPASRAAPLSAAESADTFGDAVVVRDDADSDVSDPPPPHATTAAQSTTSTKDVRVIRT